MKPIPLVFLLLLFTFIDSRVYGADSDDELFSPPKDLQLIPPSPTIEPSLLPIQKPFENILLSGTPDEDVLPNTNTVHESSSSSTGISSVAMSGGDLTESIPTPSQDDSTTTLKSSKSLSKKARRKRRRATEGNNKGNKTGMKKKSVWKKKKGDTIPPKEESTATSSYTAPTEPESSFLPQSGFNSSSTTKDGEEESITESPKVVDTRVPKEEPTPTYPELSFPSHSRFDPYSVTRDSEEENSTESSKEEPTPPSSRSFSSHSRSGSPPTTGRRVEGDSKQDGAYPDFFDLFTPENSGQRGSGPFTNSFFDLFSTRGQGGDSSIVGGDPSTVGEDSSTVGVDDILASFAPPAQRVELLIVGPPRPNSNNGAGGLSQPVCARLISITSVPHDHQIPGDLSNIIRNLPFMSTGSLFHGSVPPRGQHSHHSPFTSRSPTSNEQNSEPEEEATEYEGEQERIDPVSSTETTVPPHSSTGSEEASTSIPPTQSTTSSSQGTKPEDSINSDTVRD